MSVKEILSKVEGNEEEEEEEDGGGGIVCHSKGPATSD